jgi:uncharacterized protein
MDKIELLKKEIKKYFNHASHDISHVLRVYRLAVRIAEKENADMECIKAAALLHDIARTDEINGKIECHAEGGAKKAEQILEKFGYAPEKIRIITDAIRTHRYKNQLKPKTKVGEILQDADRLDLLGTMGIARTFARAGETRSPLHDPGINPDKKYRSSITTAINHFYEKILKVTPDTFHTRTARSIAKSRYKYTKTFIERFLKEWDGGL